jgi:FGGY-family pentulose kinase
MTRAYLGIDVGTGSARAGLFDASGTMLGAAAHPIETFHPREGFYQQSSEDIWRACGEATRRALASSGLEPSDVAGIGFDATCSLVVVDDQGRPLSVSPGGETDQNVIVWMDHRATDIAQRINRMRHPVLDFVGGVISPEMETPKLVWLKENLPETFRGASTFFDLPDFLTFRATGSATRSLCSTVCKWTYLGHGDDPARPAEGRWADDYFRQIGLGEIVDERFARIGTVVRPMGERLGVLTRRAADELGLVPGIPVGVSIIDAHAGGIGTLGAELDGERPDAAGLERRLALIGGTSSCHMAVSRSPKYIDGIWGPYYSAMVPGLWLTEGGQSATGSLIDHVIETHPAFAEAKQQATARGCSVYEVLERRLDALAELTGSRAALTADVHVLPYFHGNRSPRADPTLRGMVSGLDLRRDLDALSVLYLATVQAVAHGTRHIVDAMNGAGYRIDTILACGGGSKNPVFLRAHADATGCRLVLPKEPEAVLAGAAMLGAVASGDQPSVIEAMSAMSAAGEVIEPTGGETAAFHERKHRVFQRMFDDLVAYRGIMGSAPPASS